LPVHSLDPQRRDESLKLTLVAYAEAVRLLDELTGHLRAPVRAPLPELPFAGERRAKVAGLP
jgi:hypothetical protein